MFRAALEIVDRHWAGVWGHFWPGMPANAGVSVKDTQNIGCLSGAVYALGKSRRIKSGVPMRVAEQRRSDRGLPRGLSEGEHNRNPLYRCQFEPEFRSGLSLRVAQGEAGVSRSIASRLPNQKAMQGFLWRRTWGRLSLLTFFGEAKKVSCRRATPGLITIAITLTLAGCSTTTKKPDSQKPPQSTSKPGAYYLDDGPGDAPLPNLDKIPNAVPKAEKLHSGANRTYTVFGKTYVPNVSSVPFRQQGIGSWYGRKFHGQKTSIGETYDMYAMTAAHPTLPLPCYVRVSNPANGKSVVVRVNDRGPFHSDRIIDLSYVAAAKLDYARRGSATVVVERVFPGDRSDKLPPVAAIALSPVVPIVTPGPTAVAVSPVIPESGVLYLQLGAFSSMESAEIFRARMARELDWNREPLQVSRKDSLFRVRMGPYKSREEADAIAAQVRLSHDFSPVIQQP